MIVEPSNRARNKVLVRGAKQLVTLRGDNRPRRGREMSALHIIPDGALLIVDGVIREVGSSRRVERLAEARDADEVDATGKVVLPGFVDSITRPLHPMEGAEAFEERCRQGTVANPAPEINFSASLKNISSHRLDCEARRRMNQFLTQGTLTLAASPGWDGDPRTTLKALRVLHELSSGPVRVLPVAALGEGADLELAERISKSKFATLASIDCRDPGALEMSRRAQKLGFALRILGDARHAAELRACLWVANSQPEAAESLRDSNAVCTAYPAVNWLRGSAPPPLRALIDAGLPVALASGYGVDGSGTSNLATVMSLACMESRLTPAEAITAVTINAAFSMNVAHQAGSLAAGKSADLLLMDTGDYREIVMQPGSNLVRTIMIRGQYAKPRTAPRMPVASERRLPSSAITSRAS